MPQRKRPLWKCPKCGHRFVTRNMWHSCRRSSRISSHFRRRPAEFREIFDRFRVLMRGHGPVTVYARTSVIVFQVRVRFAGVRVRQRWVEVGLWLERRVRHPCLARVMSLRALGSHGYGHFFHFTSVNQLDPAFARLVREAYAVGAQESRVPRAGA